MYVHYPKSAVARPAEQLAGFQRVTLAPGQTRTVTIPLKFGNLSYWNEKLNRFVLEKEPVELRLGDSSADIQLTKIIEIH